MKYSIITLSLLTTLVFADFINPLPASVKALDNGGVKQAIDAYKDGIGAELVDKPGVATDNSAMNVLTLKYGSDAKINNTTIIDQVVNGNSNATAADLALAGKLSVDGAACNDANSGTTGETWLNGVCQGGVAIAGEILYSTPGTYNWIVPNGVYNVSVVTIGGGGSRSNGNNCGGGGGGLGWKNNIAVTPGQIIPIVVGDSIASAICLTAGCGNSGGTSYFLNSSTVAGFGGGAGCGTANGGTFVGDGGGNGGTGYGSYGSGLVGGAGGAGGYTGNGGNGGQSSFGVGTGGAGAGGSSSNRGGGVGIYGIGLSGTTAGAPGSGGINAKYGGGSYGTDLGKGAVRIIYGINRSFPATNVKLTSSLGNVVTY
jgi:hypothetical protein